MVMAKIVDKGSSDQSAKIAGNFSPGDIGMVLYKRKIWWPCLIRMVYSKKVSYNYLPLKDNNKSVFTAPFRNLKPFNINENIPNDADDDLREAIESAKTLYIKKFGNSKNSISHEPKKHQSVNIKKENTATNNVANIVNKPKVVIQKAQNIRSPIKCMSKNSIKMEAELPVPKIISVSPTKCNKIVVQKNTNDILPKVEVSKKDDKQNLVDLLLSDRAKVNFTDILTGKRLSNRHISFRPTKMVNSLKFDSYTESFIPFESLEKVITEYQKWIRISPDLSTYGPLTELYYIQTVLIPESIVFSLSILNHSSMEEAENVFKSFKKEKNIINQSRGEESSEIFYRNIPKQPKNDAIEALLIAAEMLQ
uniref:PWWP domain-containing protein n=1 Tax=Parastrongyloides trichosuri TaxID=131310 RepID=A0A0N4ZFY6_PARTI